MKSRCRRITRLRSCARTCCAIPLPLWPRMPSSPGTAAWSCSFPLTPKTRISSSASPRPRRTESPSSWRTACCAPNTGKALRLPLSAAGRRISHPYPHHKILQTLREGQPPAGHRYLQCQKFPVSQQQHAGGLQQCGDRGRPQHHPSRPDASLRHHAERRKGIGILSPAAFLLIFPFFDRILHGLPGQTAL